MRYGATHRGFESLPLRHSLSTNSGWNEGGWPARPGIDSHRFPEPTGKPSGPHAGGCPHRVNGRPEGSPSGVSEESVVRPVRGRHPLALSRFESCGTPGPRRSCPRRERSSDTRLLGEVVDGFRPLRPVGRAQSRDVTSPGTGRASRDRRRTPADGGDPGAGGSQGSRRCGTSSGR